MQYKASSYKLYIPKTQRIWLVEKWRFVIDVAMLPAPKGNEQQAEADDERQCCFPWEVARIQSFQDLSCTCWTLLWFALCAVA